ncbi:hypothetical protein M407DRAFT_244333 [Tulasnella calospora MUT 4182]|uniref:Uncharacterized protein n=1 Tax=Tulasnella calospora MUT 4182 TaxID=1051891 RepID=A0A0C3KTB5_9AGAM|nr:hypothetical protein M407DRAFT_244333 [Tulasnella calospora MUT 4182]
MSSPGRRRGAIELEKTKEDSKGGHEGENQKIGKARTRFGPVSPQWCCCCATPRVSPSRTPADDAKSQ